MMALEPVDMATENAQLRELLGWALREGDGLDGLVKSEYGLSSDHAKP
jgi:hypothetical protein